MCSKLQVKKLQPRFMSAWHAGRPPQYTGPKPAFTPLSPRPLTEKEKHSW